MNIKKYIGKFKQYGLIHSIGILWKIRLDWLIQDIIMLFVKTKPIQDIIIIESHNDFDCNGGTFYEYLIKNEYNKKYTIIWLLKHPENKPKTIPHNVKCFKLYGPNIIKDYYICMAKYFLADNVVTNKKRKEQISVYCGHSSFALKNVQKDSKLPDSVDHFLVSSHDSVASMLDRDVIETPEKMIFIGIPFHDILHSNNKSEITKITTKKYKKIILWMPTFRKGGGYGRNDSNIEQPMGIPLFTDNEQYEKFNKFLYDLDILVIIKIHPMQDLKNLKISNKSNIVVLTWKDMKTLDLDNYRIMSCVDAMIGDYSAAGIDFLQLDRPICYLMDDLNDYKVGLIPDYKKVLGGKQIYTYSDLTKFVINISNNVDDDSDKRKKAKEYVFEFFDSDNCKRLAEFLKL